MGRCVPSVGSWHRAGTGLGDAGVGWVSGADALGPWHGATTAASEALPQTEQQCPAWDNKWKSLGLLRKRGRY